MRGFQRTLAGVFLTAGLVVVGSAAHAAKFKVLHSFCRGGNNHPCGDGSNPQSGLVEDSAGNFYGTAPTAGTNFGTAFGLERKPSGAFKFKTIYRFCSSGFCGQNPNGTLVIDTNGNLYGTANNLVFELSPQTDKKLWSEKNLYQFCSKQNCSDGNGPVGGLTYSGASSGTPYDGTSALYGVTGGGGRNNGGTIFQLNNSGSSWTETVLYHFCSRGGARCTDGKLPISALLIDAPGNLFGTTIEGGGTEQVGVAFELSPSGSTWNYTPLYLFCSALNCTDGASPSGPLTFDASGNLLGTTIGGGASCRPAKTTGCGTIFRLIPNGVDSQEAVLHSFCQQRDCKDGAGPSGGVTVDAAGNFYGTTEVGGGHDTDQNVAGGGTVYQLSGTILRILHKFCDLPNCADGVLPRAGVVSDQSGNLFGTTEYGGEFGRDTFGGTVFRVTP